MVAGCGGSHRLSACVDWNPPGHEVTTTDVGALVYVPLIEPENYTGRGFPRGFPWTPPVSSNPGVLKPVAVCQKGLVFSLPVEAFAFRAVRPGMATVSTSLAGQWRSAKLPPNTTLRPYSRKITVRP